MFLPADEAYSAIIPPSLRSGHPLGSCPGDCGGDCNCNCNCDCNCNCRCDGCDCGCFVNPAGFSALVGAGEDPLYALWRADSPHAATSPR